MMDIDLKLVPAAKVWPTGEWGSHDFGVVHRTSAVGIIKRMPWSGDGTEWWWEITTQAAQQAAVIIPIKGLLPSKDDAKAAFRVAWQDVQKLAHSPRHDA